MRKRRGRLGMRRGAARRQAAGARRLRGTRSRSIVAACISPTPLPLESQGQCAKRLLGGQGGSRAGVGRRADIHRFCLRRAVRCTRPTSALGLSMTRGRGSGLSSFGLADCARCRAAWSSAPAAAASGRRGTARAGSRSCRRSAGAPSLVRQMRTSSSRLPGPPQLTAIISGLSPGLARRSSPSSSRARHELRSRTDSGSARGCGCA